jgi:hypothetical protein
MQYILGLPNYLAIFKYIEYLYLIDIFNLVIIIKEVSTIFYSISFSIFHSTNIVITIKIDDCIFICSIIIGYIVI